MPKYSIIIPTYNSASTLAAAISSVLEQTFSDFEILIMDGCSTDNTLDIVKSFSDNRVKICSEPDTGVYDAMNKGVNKAIGEWLFFLGSDDVFYDNNVLLSISSHLGDNDFVYGNAYFIHSKMIWDGEFSRAKLLFSRNICHQSIFYKKKLFEQLGNFNLMFKIYADWDFNIRCFSHSHIKIKYVNLIISKYDERNGLSSDAGDLEFTSLIPMDYRNEVISIKNSRAYKLSLFFSKLFNMFNKKDK